MKHLKEYFENLENAAGATNTIGMGNPGQVDVDVLTEPVCSTAKSKTLRRKKKKDGN